MHKVKEMKVSFEDVIYIMFTESQNLYNFVTRKTESKVIKKYV